MKLLSRLALLATSAVFCWLLQGCASTRDVNPPGARADRGYVDLYTEPQKDLWWKVDVFDPARQDFKEFTGEFEAPPQHIFRIEARPGKYRARISFMNLSIEAPAETDVEVVPGMITPVRVTLTEGMGSYVRKVEDRAGGPVRKKVIDTPQQLWRVSATSQPSIPYTPKEQTRYWGSK